MRALLLALFALMVSGVVWGQRPKTISKNATAAYIAPNGATKNNFQVSSGAFVFDATKRMGISNIFQKSDKTYVFKYLAEEQPDAIYETIKEFLTKASANINNQDFNVEVINNVSSMVEKLTEKSKAHIFLRSSLYRINEALFNGDIENTSYEKLFCEIITAAKDIQLKELEIMNSTQDSIENKLNVELEQMKNNN